MSAATSILSSGSEKLDAWTRRAQPKVEIDLAGQKQGHVNSYTTGESVEGIVNITAEHDTRFEEVEIVLEGIFPVICQCQDFRLTSDQDDLVLR